MDLAQPMLDALMQRFPQPSTLGNDPGVISFDGLRFGAPQIRDVMVVLLQRFSYSCTLANTPGVENPVAVHATAGLSPSTKLHKVRRLTDSATSTT